MDIKQTSASLEHETDHNGLPIGKPVGGWQARQTPPKSDMRGQLCKLEPFNLERHGDGLYNAFCLDEAARNWTYLPYGPFSSLQDFKHWCERDCLGDDPLFHTIYDLDTNTITGMASFLRIKPAAGSIEVGHIHFSPLMQGTRIATEAMYLMLKRVFEELEYRRYEWKCDALNSPSCRAAKRLGFQFEGIFRQATVYKGRNRDTAWFSILDKDWPQLRTGYETWLSNSNFDENGQQIKSLTDCLDSPIK